MLGSHFVFAVLLSLCFANTIHAGTNNPLTYGYPFALRQNGSPSANCIRDLNATHYPLYCSQTNVDLTTFTITGTGVTAGDFATSPTTPASLNPYGSGSSSAWCYPKNDYNNYPDGFTVECNGAPLTPWFQLVKVGGVYGDGIYSGDSVVINDTKNGLFCGNTYVNCNTDGITLAATYTIIFA